jgi:hypothetical protein
MMGMDNDIEYLGLEPEYRLPWIEVYKNTAIALLKGHGPMVLSYCIPFDRQQRHIGLPSWVSDWYGMIRLPFRGMDATFTYGAGRNLRNNLTTSLSGLVNILSMQGAIFDQVAKLGDVPEGSSFEDGRTRQDIVKKNWKFS